MRKQAKIVIGSVAVVAIVAASSVVLARLSLKRHIAGGIGDLPGAGAVGESLTATEEGVAALPEPVHRWRNWSGVVGKPILATVRLRQEGELRVEGFG